MGNTSYKGMLTFQSYREILNRILVHQDERSKERIRRLLGWIAFAKRPLKKLELLSAMSFGEGDPRITHIVPKYMLDMCRPFVEEGQDTTLSFIHVSVKE